MNTDLKKKNGNATMAQFILETLTLTASVIIRQC